MLFVVFLLMGLSSSLAENESAFKLLDSKVALEVGFGPSATKRVHVFHLATPDERNRVIQNCLDSATPTYWPPSVGDGLGDALRLIMVAPLVRVVGSPWYVCKLTSLPAGVGSSFEFTPANKHPSFYVQGGAIWLYFHAKPSIADVSAAIQRFETEPRWRIFSRL